MRVLFTLVLVTFSSFAFGQLETLMKPWSVGKSKIFNGHTILRVEGVNGIQGLTNISYTSYSQGVKNLEALAINQMWSEERKVETLKEFEKLALGGVIELFVSRLTIDAADTKFFTIIVKDSTDQKEVWRETFESSIAQVPIGESDYWWNSQSSFIPIIVDSRIYVYVVDGLCLDNCISKFAIDIK